MSFVDLKDYLRIKASLKVDNENMKKIGTVSLVEDDFNEDLIFCHNSWYNSGSHSDDDDFSDDSERPNKEIKLDPLSRRSVVSLSRQLARFNQPQSLVHLYTGRLLNDAILLYDYPIEEYSRQDLLEMAVPSMFYDPTTGTTETIEILLRYRQKMQISFSLVAYGMQWRV